MKKKLEEQEELERIKEEHFGLNNQKEDCDAFLEREEVTNDGLAALETDLKSIPTAMYSFANGSIKLPRIIQFRVGSWTMSA